MKANEIKVGEVYVAKVSGVLTHLRVNSVDAKARTGYRGVEHGFGGNGFAMELVTTARTCEPADRSW